MSKKDTSLKITVLYFWFSIFMIVVSILSGASLAYIGIFKESMKIENLILPAILIVSAIVFGLVALKLVKPFAKMAFLKEIMQCAKYMICCDSCDDDNSNENQTQGNKSQKDKSGKNDEKDTASDNQQDKGSQNEKNEHDEKAKLDAEKDLIKKFCDTLAEL